MVCPAEGGHWPAKRSRLPPRSVAELAFTEGGNEVVKRALIVGMMLLFASSPVWADFDEAMRAYDSGDFATALHEFQILAERG